MTHPNSFGKAEHLCGEKRINRLFTQGQAFIVYPLRVVYIFGEERGDVSVLTMVSVPKKRFKRAVKRNRLKRLMRETYRLNKSELCARVSAKNLQLQLSFNYVSNEEVNFETMEKKMKIALQKMCELTDKESIVDINSMAND